MTQFFDFGSALYVLKTGGRVAREGWNGKKMYIFLVELDESEPFIAMHTASGKKQYGWLASQPDMLAEDWMVVS